MELRSGRRLSSQSMRGAPRLPRPRHCPDSGGEDGISALPDDILLQILVRLRCARAAALTSSLSRRWLGLWRHLFELSFREIPLDAIDAALQQVACPALSRLEIQIPIEHRIDDAARVSALLQAAAQFAPADLVFDVWGDCKDREIPIEIPCFQRAASIKLSIANLYLTLPAGRVEFPVLEKLCLARCRLDDMNMVELISRRCPHLRVLEFRLKAILGSTHFSVLFSAPMVEDLSWSCLFHHHNIGISEIWCVRSLDIRTEESAYVLALQIAFMHEDFFLDGDMFQRIGPLPEFSVLEVHLGSYGHVFGAIMLDLLGTCSTIRRLMVNMQSSPRTQACPPDCLCDESPNWRSQTIPLMSLQEIKIKGFNGTDHEVDFLKLLFRCATLMKRMTVRISSKLFPGDIGYKEMCNIFEANPSVQCSVYRRSESY
uniref:Uncharacterized protein n=1 Tax=Avena sativa TaxID=4498 RepID=A0ACD5XN24_AVESA